MHWSARIPLCVAYSLLGFVCALILSIPAISVQFGTVLTVINPFIMLGFGEFAFHALWPGCLLFGVWLGFLPPRRWPAYSVFCFAALAAGVWASYSYQLFEWPEYPFEAGLERVPPTFHLVSATTASSCVIALATAILCSFVARRLFRSPLPNHALQRTEAGGTSVLHP